MQTVLALLVAASPALALYEAQVPTFGCSSSSEVAKLQAVRADAAAFGQLLTSQVAYGQCVTVPRGAVVEGSIVDAETSTLLINVRNDPPGYRVPLSDFKATKPARTGGDVGDDKAKAGG